jgi:hypothetical protein
MPPRDPRLCPALERALPDDDVPGSTRVLDWPEPWKVLFGSGEWRTVRVRQRGRDVRGREVIGVEWFAEGEAWSGSYVVDSERAREPEG